MVNGLNIMHKAPAQAVTPYVLNKHASPMQQWSADRLTSRGRLGIINSLCKTRPASSPINPFPAALLDGRFLFFILLSRLANLR